MEVVVLAAVVEVDVHIWRGTCRNQVLRGSSVVVLGEMHVDGSSSRQETVVVHGVGRGSSCSRGDGSGSRFVVDVVELDETLSNSSGAYRSGTWRIQHLRA